MRLVTAVLVLARVHVEVVGTLILKLMILCSVSLIIVILMCAMLRNFDFLERIIELNPENNRKTFQEVRNRIFGKILSIIASSLIRTRVLNSHTKSAEHSGRVTQAKVVISLTSGVV